MKRKQLNYIQSKITALAAINFYCRFIADKSYFIDSRGKVICCLTLSLLLLGKYLEFQEPSCFFFYMEDLYYTCLFFFINAVIFRNASFTFDIMMKIAETEENTDLS